MMNSTILSVNQVEYHPQWQQGIVVNQRTMNQDHMKENLNFFDFELSDDEMKQISNIKPPSDPKVCPDPHNIKYIDNCTEKCNCVQHNNSRLQCHNVLRRSC